ncbi:anticodon-binding domain-containing protein [Cladochytrium replicatum]|nr:anticodon-binding domain-containing protein [Cladochytrium replicatum]
MDPSAAVGLWVKLRTVHDQFYEGQIFCYDQQTNTIVLQSQSAPPAGPGVPPPPKYDFHILKVNYVKDVQPIEPKNGEKPAGAGEKGLVPVTFVPIEKMQQREHVAIRAEKEKLAKVGVGVTDEAQDIFDALSKTLPTSWRADKIVVLDEVIISSPYLPENCSLLDSKKSNGHHETPLQRVRMILDGERRRLGLNGTPTTAVGVGADGKK